MNNSTNTLTLWLDHLQILLPPSHITLVGAGNGKGAWVRWLQKQEGTATLVEADSLQFAALQRLQAVGHLERVTLLNTVLAPEVREPVEFFTASLAAENGLLRPEELRQFWPNLYTLAMEPVQATALNSLLEAKQGQQWLLLDCLPAAALLQSAQAELSQVDVVLARVLLGQEKAVQLVGVSLAEVAKTLPNFIQLALQPTHHPDIAYVLFARDYLSVSKRTGQALEIEAKARQFAQQAQARLEVQLAAVKVEKNDFLQKQELQAKAQQELQSSFSRIVQERETESQEKAELQLQLQETQEQLQAQTVKTSELHDDFSRIAQERETESQEKAQLQLQLQKTQEQLQAQTVKTSELHDDFSRLAQERETEIQEKSQLQLKLQKTQEQLQSQTAERSELHEFFKKQADEIIYVRQFLDASLKKEINNATRQIQAFTGLENYWRTGELPTANTEGHGWPVSSDFSLYIVGLLKQNDYDVIIEFGSGISTVVVAKALAKLSSTRAGKFPVEFISFDHLEQYYQQTKDLLQQAGLTAYVQLQHTPLEDWRASNGKIYSYYACQENLAALAQKNILSEKLRVLVIVDGPPAATGSHARYPAAPLVLQHFSGAHIDFLMDDYIRMDEKEIIQFWGDEMTAAHIGYISIERKMERDACLFQIFKNEEI